MRKTLPFSLTARKDSPYYYVRLRNEETGKFMSWVSTKETNYSRAVRAAWEIYNRAAQSRTLEKKSFYDTVRKSDYTREDVLFFLEDFRRRGFVTSWVMNDGTAPGRNALEWLTEFWTPGRSEYLNEKARKGQAVHRRHIENSAGFLAHHWSGLLGEKKLGELTRADIQAQFNRLDGMELNGNTKNHILRAVMTPLRWAFNSEILPKDITRGWTMYKVTYRKRPILTRAMAEAVFREEWTSRTAKLASMLSMCTGMRCGEILALTPEDIGDDRIFVRHSYSTSDGLKCTKNGEARTVYVPFPFLIRELRSLAARNPHESGAGFVFWGKSPDRPLCGSMFLRAFRRALVQTGMDRKEAEEFSFHSWRHFYTMYMVDKVNAKALQSQTGHKTREMLEHYADHQTLEEAGRITAAQMDTFGPLLLENG